MNRFSFPTCKKIINISLITVLVGVYSSAYAAENCVSLTGCERAICEKQNELEKANYYDDLPKIIGIQKSLVHMRYKCFDHTENIHHKAYVNELDNLKKEYKEDLDEALEEYVEDSEDARKDRKTEKLESVKKKYEEKVQTITSKYQRKREDLKLHHNILK